MSEKHLITQDPKKLEKLHEFAKRGGIGKGIANQDTLADTEDDLMFFTGETVTILKHIKDEYFLGYCEGVIGKFKGSAIKFNESDQNKNVVVIPTFKIDLVPDTITKSSISEQFNIKENPKVIITSKDLKNNEIKEIVLESFKIETSIVIDESAIESSLRL
ncbi:18389_t:CDS:2 [Entrophospora sp. SA101]|nr:18389_t:CDS:2 [Entrophospora sp. SA101]